MKHGIDKNNLDIKIDPRKNFYEYACGGWIKKNPMPDDFSSYGAFDVLREKSRKQIKELITNLSSDPLSKVKGNITQKINDLYNLGMDEKRLNEEGASPLYATLSKVKEKIKDNDLTSLIAWLHLGLDASFFSSGVGPDPADSNLNMLHIGETGLGLGDRDYYLEDNETNRKILKAYETYVKRITELTGFNKEESQRIWNNVISLERKLAEHKKTREQRRNPLLSHNVYDIERLKEEFNFLDWERYFKELGIVNPDRVNITSVDYLKYITELLPTLTKEEIEDYLIFSLISNSTGLLSDDFSDADFELYGKVMSGQKEKKPRWKKALAIPDSMFGEAVGELYVKKYFPAENKDYMLILVENLKKSLDKHISNLTWMSDETKSKAREKLKHMTVKIGYPDKWKDYSGIEINPEKSYHENVQKASIWYTKDNYNKLNKPVDKKEWHMTPQTVNAYYSPVNNEICFPAAILQPPFFDIEADDAINYGAIGVVIGHEMTHGFDDQGRQFDKEGNLENWWKPEDEENFKKKTDVLVEQFNAVEVVPGVHANGLFTLGENIADQGGLNIALTAYLDLKEEKTDIDGFSPLQRFFIGFANVWAGSIRHEEILLRTKTDPHSLAKNRVNVTLKNIDSFFEAFNIEKGDEMFRPKEDRIVIW
ncbi:MAG: M13 family metallopeptidase [Muribaculaceae bacterium]|nr:M13 family metallopeptidase [Muribaculaceae bacterium]